LRNLLLKSGQELLGTITHVSTTDPIVALTFDDGPHPQFTPRLLEILAKHNAFATFFMIGKNAKQYPEIVQRVAMAGHAIGNHSWDHSLFPAITRSERFKQIRECQKAIDPYGSPIFRPPKGYQSIASRLDALLLGYKVIAWNVGGLDYLGHRAEWIVDHLINKLNPGSIIDLHDSLWDTIVEGAGDRSETLQAVDILLEKVGDKLHFITIPELLKYGSPKKCNWYMNGQ